MSDMSQIRNINSQRNISYTGTGYKLKQTLKVLERLIKILVRVDVRVHIEMLKRH